MKQLFDQSGANGVQLKDIAKYADCFSAGSRFYRSMYNYVSNNADMLIDGNTTAGYTKNPFEIQISGDSIPGYMNAALIKLLTVNKNINGLGFSNFASYGGSFGYPYEKLVKTGFAITQDDISSAENWGICGRCLKGSGTDTIKYQTLEPYPHTDFSLFFCKKVGGGSFSYSVDGGTPVTVDTNDVATSLGCVEINGLVEKCHTIDIAIVSGSVTLYGIRTWRKNKGGVLLNLLNEGGTTCLQWATQMTMMTSYLALYPPNQFHMWIGANDCGVSTDAQFKVNLDLLFNTYNLSTMCDYVFYTHYERGLNADITQPDTSYNALMLGFDARIRETAKAFEGSIFDIAKIFPSRNIGYNAGMFSDAIHSSEKGASVVAMLAIDRCLPKLDSNNFVNKRTFENTLKNPIFMAGKRNKLEYITNPATTGAFTRCGVLGADGKIYAFGRNTPDVICIDPAKNTAEVCYYNSSAGGNLAWCGAVAAPNGLIYLIPCRGNKVYTFNPIYNTLSEVATVTIVASTDNWTGGVLTPEGKIYCVPSSDTQANILVIDTWTNTVSYIDRSATSTASFAGGAYAPNGKIYFTSANSVDILVVDTSNDTCYKLTNDGSGGGSKYFGAVVGQNGKVHFIPQYAGEVLVIDPATDAITYITSCDTANRPSYRGGVLATDGKIYCPPYGSTKMLVIDPVAGTKDETTYTGFTADGTKWGGAVLAPNGKIYCIPNSATQIMVINPGFPTVQIQPLLSPIYNKSW